VKILTNIAYSGKTCTCRSWNSASQKKFYHLNVVIEHGSTSPYPSLFEGKMLRSKELRIPTAQDYGCNTSAYRNRVSSQLHLAKKKFFNSLNLSNPKSFWKSVKALDKRDTSTSALTHDGSPCLTDQQKQMH